MHFLKGWVVAKLMEIYKYLKYFLPFLHIGSSFWFRKYGHQVFTGMLLTHHHYSTYFLQFPSNNPPNLLIWEYEMNL